jgi:hypothetical protein
MAPSELTEDTSDEEAEPRPLKSSSKRRRLQCPGRAFMVIMAKHFPDLRQVALTNLDPVEILAGVITDARVEELRGLGHAEVACSPQTQTYALRASQGQAAAVDLIASARENEARVPPGVVFDPLTTLAPAEALFLREHADFYKNGKAFCSVHPEYSWASLSACTVREKYRKLVCAGCS